MIDVDEFTTVGTWPQLGRGGWMRNFHGEVIVSHPDGGKRTCRYEGMSALIDETPYRGDTAHGDRGQLVHDINGHAVRGEPLPDELIASGVALGVSAELQQHIYDSWLEFRAALGLRNHGIEETAVMDAWGCASNIDWRDEWPDGVQRVGDTKTGADPIKVNTIVQLAGYTRTRPYDVVTGTRGDWVPALDIDVAYIYWFPILKAMNADLGDWPTWKLIRVDLAIGHQLGDTRYALKNDTSYKEAFTPIAVPSTPSPDVEREPEGDGGLPSPSEARPPDGDDDWMGRRSELLARHAALVAKGVTVTLPADKTDLDAIEAAIDKAEAGVTRHRATAAAATLPTVADEGDPIDAGLVAAIGARYAALPDAARSWVTACGAEIRLSGSTGVASVRRFEALRGLLILATDGFDDDNTVRAIAWHIFGDVVHFANVRPARIIGALGVDEAKRFALMADALAAGRGSMRFTSDARCFIDGLGQVAA